MPLLVAATRLNGLAPRRHAGRRRVLPAVHAAGECHLRPPDRPGERRDGIIADDGIRVGNRGPHRAAGRLDGRSVRHRADPDASSRSCRSSAALCAVPLPGGPPHDAAGHADAVAPRQAENVGPCARPIQATVSYSFGPGPMTPAVRALDHR
ncbi:MAG: hypothetical protein MZU84_04030 [Sphingobacterium sp.]|nr:hypothetical protein [Sphingobacterium sp.]